VARNRHWKQRSDGRATGNKYIRRTARQNRKKRNKQGNLRLFCTEGIASYRVKASVKNEMPEAREFTVTRVGDTWHSHNKLLCIIIIIIIKAYDARRRRCHMFLALQARVVRQSMPSVQTLATPSHSFDA
jgi:hypothetical protein